MAPAQQDDPDKNSGILKWADNGGEFKRQVSAFRDEIKKGGRFPPEKGRYHLYVSLACPWAHRALIVRQLKGLSSFIGVSVVHPHMLSKGWSFETDFPGATGDTLHLDDAKITHMRDIYFKVEPNYDARFTVPIIYDTKEGTIVSNESSEIIRFLNEGFNDLLEQGSEERKLDLYPEGLRKEIDELNEWVYDTVNNGVYKSGFATTQEAYEKAVFPLFSSLDRLEKLLKGKTYLVGDTLTEADVRLFTTIIRFDPVYHQHFKCNIGSIRHDFPEINRWCKELYWKNEAFRETTDFAHIKEHYMFSHKQINPYSIICAGPIPNIEPL